MYHPKYAYVKNNPLNYVDPDGNAAVKGTIANFEKYYSPLLTQQKGKTGLGNVCGAMAMLIAFNHYSRASGTIPDFVKNSTAVADGINRLYTYSKPFCTIKNLCIAPLNLNQGLSHFLMNQIASGKWGWKYAKTRSSYYYKTPEESYSQLIADLQANRITIPLMAANSSFVPIKQPNDTEPKYEKYRHFIVVYYADDLMIKYQDPYDGLLKYATKKLFLASWTSTRIVVVVGPK